MTISFLSLPISPVVKTSIPNLKGILRRFSFTNSGFPFLGSFTSLMSNLAALLPMSIAAIFMFYISFGLWKNKKFFSAFLKSFQLSAEILKATTEQVGMCSIFSLVRELAK